MKKFLVILICLSLASCGPASYFWESLFPSGPAPADKQQKVYVTIVNEDTNPIHIAQGNDDPRKGKVYDSTQITVIIPPNQDFAYTSVKVGRHGNFPVQRCKVTRDDRNPTWIVSGGRLGCPN
ncbi:MAG: hypothetical protein ACE5FT_05410 [Candidatus Nanoarchaeia archaeon]